MSQVDLKVLIDTGPIVALFDRNDTYHQACVEVSHHLPDQVFTCWPVITEACYLLRSRPDLVERLLESVAKARTRYFHLVPPTFLKLEEL